jgi:hypothetical protein
LLVECVTGGVLGFVRQAGNRSGNSTRIEYSGLPFAPEGSQIVRCESMPWTLFFGFAVADCAAHRTSYAPKACARLKRLRCPVKRLSLRCRGKSRGSTHLHLQLREPPLRRRTVRAAAQDALQVYRALKPPWCQPWTILLFGEACITFSWCLLPFRPYSAIITSVLILVWWYVFLWEYPRIAKATLHSFRSTASRGRKNPQDDP